MNKLILIFITISQVLLGADLATIKSSIYKIRSKAQGIANELKGSGILFSKASKYYVLTSDHIVIHSNGFGNESSAQCADTATCKPLKLKFLGSEWGLGLAILEVEGNPGRKVLTYEELTTPSILKVGDKLSFYGYPFEQNELVEETEAKALNLTATVPYYAFAPNLYEFDALVGEFGMSGGGAFTEDGKFLGVLAYQKILNGNRDNRVYALPQDITMKWVNHYFETEKDFKPILSEPWWAQKDPTQIIFTNNGYVYMFRYFNGEIRYAAARIEALILLSDIPTIQYDDSRGILKQLRADLDKNVYAPAELSLIDRNLSSPSIITIQYPAMVIRDLERKGVTLFVARGERHELRYARFRPVVETLGKDIAALKTKLGGNLEEKSTALLKDLDALVERCNSVPPKPTDPGTAGASEFFNSLWMGNQVLSIEANEKLEGWSVAGAKAGAEALKVKETLKKLVESLNVFEIKGR